MINDPKELVAEAYQLIQTFRDYASDMAEGHLRSPNGRSYECLGAEDLRRIDAWTARYDRLASEGEAPSPEVVVTWANDYGSGGGMVETSDREQTLNWASSRSLGLIRIERDAKTGRLISAKPWSEGE